MDDAYTLRSSNRDGTINEMDVTPEQAREDEIAKAAKDEAFEVWDTVGRRVHDAIEREDLNRAAQAASTLARGLAALAALANPQAASALVDRYHSRLLEEQHADASPNRIAQFRMASGGMTTAELADRIGVDEQRVIRWERGEEAIPDDYAVKLGDVFGVAVPYLLRLES